MRMVTRYTRFQKNLLNLPSIMFLLIIINLILIIINDIYLCKDTDHVNPILEQARGQ